MTEGMGQVGNRRVRGYRSLKIGRDGNQPLYKCEVTVYGVVTGVATSSFIECYALLWGT